jgi:hypothetical protein
MSLGGKLVITANILDINTAQILSSSRLQLNGIGEVFDKIPGFVADTVKALPKPVYKIGDAGPGGGIVFFVEGGTYMEVSGILGSVNWSEALTLARNYRGGGYSNWRLPTRLELNFIYQNLRAKNIGNLGDSWHWSSSEDDSIFAWGQLFRDGRQGGNAKGNTTSVRAIRAF